MDKKTLDLLLQKAINQTLDAGIKCGKILPEVKINIRATSFLGRCSVYTEYKGENVYVIEISKRALLLDEDALMNTLCHEVLHSCKECIHKANFLPETTKKLFLFSLRKNGNRRDINREKKRKNSCHIWNDDNKGRTTIFAYYVCL